MKLTVEFDSEQPGQAFLQAKLAREMLRQVDDCPVKLKAIYDEARRCPKASNSFDKILAVGILNTFGTKQPPLGVTVRFTR
jgi:hypothetical protein